MILPENHAQQDVQADADSLVSLPTFRGQHQRLDDLWGPREVVVNCPNARWVWLNRETGVLGPRDRCRASTCLFCLRVSAAQVHKAVVVAQPSHFVTLTGLSGNWETDRTTVNLLRRYLRRDGLAFAFAWAIEPNPGGTGHHAHGWAWGDPRFEETIQRRANQVGLGDVDVERVTYEGNFAYPVKNATHNQASLGAHRRLNGREFLHARGFWRDAQTGTTLTKDEALHGATQRDPMTPGPWVRVPADTVGDQRP